MEEGVLYLRQLDEKGHQTVGSILHIVKNGAHGQVFFILHCMCGQWAQLVGRLTSSWVMISLLVGLSRASGSVLRSWSLLWILSLPLPCLCFVFLSFSQK